MPQPQTSDKPGNNTDQRSRCGVVDKSLAL